MTPIDIIRDCFSKKIELRLEAGTLKVYSREGPVGESMLELVRQHKEGIIDLLEKEQNTRSQYKEYMPTLSISEFPLSNLNQESLDRLQETYRHIDDLYVATPVQAGMLFHSLLEENTSRYATQTFCSFKGNLNISCFRRAWEELVKRHEILRTCFVAMDAESMHQLVLRDIDIPFRVMDLRGVPAGDRGEAVRSCFEMERAEAFDFARPPLMRVMLVQLSEYEFRFLWTHHHAITDGWSNALLFAELLHLHETLASGNPEQLKPSIPYRNYIHWLSQRNLAAAGKFWRDYVVGGEGRLLLQDRQRGVLPDTARTRIYKGHTIRIASEVMDNLIAIGRREKTTLNVVLQAAWAWILAKYTGQTDVMFGTTVSGRPADLDDVEQMVGLFINTIPLRVQVGYDITLSGLLHQIHSGSADRDSHSFYSLADIKKFVNESGEGELFDTVLVFENYPDIYDKGGSLTCEGFGTTDEQTNYPLTIVVSKRDGFAINFVYDIAECTDGLVEGISRHFAKILNSMGVSSTDEPIRNIEMLELAERAVLLGMSRGEVRPNPSACLHEVFEDHARRSPNVTAAVFNGERLTYRQLNDKADQLARQLAVMDVKPSQVIGICLNPSCDVLVAILASLKTGCTYLPVDPGMPIVRWHFIAQEVTMKILLAHNEYAERFRADGIKVCILLDGELTGNQPVRAGDIRLHRTAIDKAAYVLFTSGSTGKPKGVEIHHSALNNYLAHAARAYYEHAHLGVVATALSFDATVTSLLAPLVAGKTVEILPSGQTVELLAEHVTRSPTDNVYKVTPSHLKAILQLDINRPSSRHHIFVVGGEQLHTKIAKRFLREIAPEARIVNEYGPTESTVGCSTYTISLSDPELDCTNVVPIGLPIPNTSMYVLDQHGQLAAPGVAGELYIGGASLAAGYAGRPELTSERFISNSDLENGEQRLYKTGDKVRWLDSGNLEFLGRFDDQVKVNGYRIELPEIQKALETHSAVRSCEIVVREDANEDPQIVAYFVPEDTALSGTLITAELREYLGNILPPPMIPAWFVQLRNFPLNANGKVDKTALPAPDADMKYGEYKAPSNAIEHRLVSIFANVLKLDVDRLGVHDSFFALGGHSLSAIRLTNLIQRDLKLKIPLRTIFDAPTVSALAEQISSMTAGETLPPIPRVENRRNAPLSFAQQGLWFLARLGNNSAYYNISFALRMHGALDESALRSSLSAILRRHEVLRARFVDNENGDVEQVVDSDLDPGIDVRDFPDETGLPAFCQREAMTPFDLAQDRLIRFTLLNMASDKHVLLVTMYHGVSDGWSIGVFADEFRRYYISFKDGCRNSEECLPVQYADFAYWQRNCIDSVLEVELDYWLRQLDGIPPILEFPTDFPRTSDSKYPGAHEKVSFSRSLLNQLNKRSAKSDVTLYMLLLSAFAILLSKYSGQSDICIGFPVAGRNRPELENLIGLFVNTLVMRIDVSGDPLFEELLTRVKETALGAYANQNVPFEYLVNSMQPERDLAYSPLFQVQLILNNAPVNLEPLGDLDLSLVEYDIGMAKYDFVLILDETEAGLCGSVSYRTDLFRSSTMRRLIENFECLLTSIVERPCQNISKLDLISAKEKHELTFSWNNTSRNFPAGKCFHHLFEEQVERTPDNIALSMNGKKLTYREMENRANQYAHYLISKGVGPEVPVAICAERSLEMIIAIFGVLKAGGAYVPIDSSYPESRIHGILRDSAVDLVLTHQSIVEQIPALGEKQIVPLDLELMDLLFKDCEYDYWRRPKDRSKPQDLAYIIFTSGSTGRPKGAMIEHRSWVNLAYAQADMLRPSKECRGLQFASLGFDAAAFEISAILPYGGALHLIDEVTQKSPGALSAMINREKITHATLPPVMLGYMSPQDLHSVTTLVVAGEAVTGQQADKWSKSRRLINGYGPTEATVCATAARLGDSDVTIGRPLPNVTAWVLGHDSELLPIGATGELHIGGVGLARGYLNRPIMTGEKFINTHNTNREDEILYKTGDLVRFRADGNIEFLGRTDEQIKIRGCRVELCEVEKALNSIDSVDSAHVTIVSDDRAEPRIIGYVRPRDHDDCESYRYAFELERELRKILPSFMLPSSIIVVADWPLTSNGKIDSHALPKPGVINLGDRYNPPSTDIEKALVGIWSQLLDLEEGNIGVDVGFFSLGGHSLLATKMITQIRSVLNVDIPIKEVFRCQTIEELAKWITEERGPAPSRHGDEDPMEMEEGRI